MTAGTSLAVFSCYYDRLVAPRDTAQAYDAWQANCGPCALAAVLGVPVGRVRRLFPDFAQKPWVNSSVMWSAVSLAGYRGIKRGRQWPAYGLAFVQWDGPWLAPGVPIGAAYRHTHRIGVAHTYEYGKMIYDINATGETDIVGAWVPLAWWKEEVVPHILASIPRACNWWLRWTCEVIRQQQKA